MSRSCLRPQPAIRLNPGPGRTQPSVVGWIRELTWWWHGDFFWLWIMSNVTVDRAPCTAWCSEIAPLRSLDAPACIPWRQRTNFTAPGCMAARSTARGADRADTFVVAQRDNNAVVVVPSIFAGARTSCNQEANFSDWRISARTLDPPLIAQLLLLCVFRKLSLLIRESENQGRRLEPCTNAIHHKANRKRVANLLAFSLSIHSRVGLDRVQLSLGNWTGGPTSSIRHDQSQPLQIIRVIDRSEVRRIPEEIVMNHSA